MSYGASEMFRVPSHRGDSVAGAVPETPIEEKPRRALGARIRAGVVAVAFVYLVILSPTPTWVRVVSGLVLAPLWFFVGRPKRQSQTPWGEQFLRNTYFGESQDDPEYLRNALTDPEVRGVAAKALADLEARDAIPELLRLLDVNEPHARVAAAKALGQLKAREAVPRLMETARAAEPEFVRYWAGSALGQIGDHRATPLLIDMLNSSSGNWKMRTSALHALGLLGDPMALEPVLRERRKDRWHWRYYVLMRPAYPDAVRLLRQAAHETR